jgi:hypothetical protein
MGRVEETRQGKPGRMRFRRRGHPTPKGETWVLPCGAFHAGPDDRGAIVLTDFTRFVIVPDPNARPARVSSRDRLQRRLVDGD